MSNTSDPMWNQTMEYSIPFHELNSHYLEFTVLDYDSFNVNKALGRLVIGLSGKFNTLKFVVLGWHVEFGLVHFRFFSLYALVVFD